MRYTALLVRSRKLIKWENKQVTDRILTVAELKRELAAWSEDTEVVFGSTMLGAELEFYRFKSRGAKILHIELNEVFPSPGKYSIEVDQELCE
jgi:hypothetical protein